MAPPAASNSKTWPPVGGPPDLDGDAFFQPIAASIPRTQQPSPNQQQAGSPHIGDPLAAITATVQRMTHPTSRSSKSVDGSLQEQIPWKRAARPLDYHPTHPQSQPRPTRFDECRFRPHFHGPSKKITDIKQRWPNHSRSSGRTSLHSSPWRFFFITVQQHGQRLTSENQMATFTIQQAFVGHHSRRTSKSKPMTHRPTGRNHARPDRRRPTPLPDLFFSITQKQLPTRSAPTDLGWQPPVVSMAHQRSHLEHASHANKAP
ncbi:hypothetical protein ACLOJK_029267 [Asimina triloba]